MSQEQQEQQEQYPKWYCNQCDKPGHKQYLEELPRGGKLLLAIHDDGSEPHRLGEFIAQEKPVKKSKKPKIVTCPECGKKGNLWATGIGTLKYGRPEHERGLWINYEVVHGERNKDQERHKIDDPHQRAVLLESLGRLLDKSLLDAKPEGKVKKKRGRGRPRKKERQKELIQVKKKTPITPQLPDRVLELRGIRQEINARVGHILQMLYQNGNGSGKKLTPTEENHRLEIAKQVVRIDDIAAKI